MRLKIVVNSEDWGEEKKKHGIVTSQVQTFTCLSHSCLNILQIDHQIIADMQPSKTTRMLRYNVDVSC